MKFQKIDWFKLTVFIFLVILLIILLLQKNPARKAPESAGEPPVVEERGELDNKEEKEFPDFPSGAESLTIDEAGSSLVDLDGNFRFALSNDGKNWIPVIPDAVKANLPDGYQVVQDESGVWHIMSADGEALYVFNHKALEWEMMQIKTDEEPEVIKDNTSTAMECAGANPQRIAKEGQKVRVVNALIPLRSSPDATSANFITSLPQDTVLEILAEPVCTTFLEGANLWWYVRTKGGLEGYAAEGSAVSGTYYLEVVN